MKRLLSMIMAVSLITALFIIPVEAANKEDIVGATYNASNHSLSVTPDKSFRLELGRGYSIVSNDTLSVNNATIKNAYTLSTFQYETNMDYGVSKTVTDLGDTFCIGYTDGCTPYMKQFNDIFEVTKGTLNIDNCVFDSQSYIKDSNNSVLGFYLSPRAKRSNKGTTEGVHIKLKKTGEYAYYPFSTSLWHHISLRFLTNGEVKAYYGTNISSRATDYYDRFANRYTAELGCQYLNCNYTETDVSDILNIESSVHNYPRPVQKCSTVLSGFLPFNCTGTGDMISQSQVTYRNHSYVDTTRTYYDGRGSINTDDWFSQDIGQADCSISVNTSIAPTLLSYSRDTQWFNGCPFEIMEYKSYSGYYGSGYGSFTPQVIFRSNAAATDIPTGVVSANVVTDFTPAETITTNINGSSSHGGKTKFYLSSALPLNVSPSTSYHFTVPWVKNTVTSATATRQDSYHVYYSDGTLFTLPSSLKLNNCTCGETLNSTLTSVFNGSVPVEINGGNYSGSPALQSGSITVNKGTLTDNNSTKSTYIVGEDSEASSTTSGATTVTQVKLSNPPVTINWDDFPMPDLSAPTIEVTRNPGDTKAPCTEVTLTIKATDPDGNDSDTPISVNGGAFQASPATYTVTENGSVDIVARDANGNTRTFTVNVNNIDSEAPTIDSFTKSNTEWTDDPVRVTVAAHDDVKLHETPYKWSFTANSSGSTTTSDWTSEKSYRCEEAGVLQVTVRDKMGHETVSDEFEVFNIDKIAPSATISITPDATHEASAKTGVTAELSFNNVVDTVSQQASPLSSAAVLWDPGEGWTEQTRHVYKENGTYQVQVRDSVGNVSDPINFTISNISTSLPVIDSFVSSTAGSEFAPAPAAVTVTAHASGSATLPARPYSWDEGQSWTSQNSLEILENGEYTVQVRDSVGNQVEATIVVSNIDPKPPTVGVYVYKGLPADGSGTGPDDYVWKVRVEADDVGSGIDHVETLWDSGTHSTIPVIQDIEEPGIYGAIAYDKAGNRTYAEKVVTAESIGESAGGTNGSYVDIKVPSSGSAGSYMDAALQDLVYGPTGAYNKSTDTFKTYEAGSEGITANMTFTAKSSRYVTGYATFNAVKYPVTFDGGVTGIAGGRNLPATVYIPISSVTGDVRQGRLTVVLQEWEDDTKTTLVREGSATFYTSVQVTSPVLNYQYSAGSDELLVTGTSSVAGISDVGVQLDGGAMQTSFPVSVGSATSIRMVVRDKVGQETEMTVSNTDLQLNGMSGGVLPTQTVDGINSYVTRSRNGTLYIVNGTQSNTDQIPASEVFDALGG